MLPARAPAPQVSLKELRPLDPPAPLDASARALLDRLTTPYRFHAFTKIPATQSVTSLTKHGRSAPGGTSASESPIIQFGQKLAMPKCVAGDGALSPTELGTLTHAALQHLDFPRACDAADLARQVAELIAARKLRSDIGGSIDLPAIEWLMQTELGRLICKQALLVRREVPIYYPSTVIASEDPMDRVMIRGQIDALIPSDNGLVLVDYKTDRVTDETVDARAEFYRGQVEAYGDAVGRITGESVKTTYLVFLTPRILKRM